MSTEAIELLTAIKEQADRQTELLTYLVNMLESYQDAAQALVKSLTSQAQPQPAATAAPSGDYVQFVADVITLAYDDKGSQVIKARGGTYSKYGVRIWPEVLPLLGIDPATLKPGPNPYGKPVIALLGEHGPRKVTGPGQS